MSLGRGNLAGMYVCAIDGELLVSVPLTGANLQRSCENISPYGIPPLICGRPFKEAIAAPSLLTGLGLDSSKRLLCSRQRQQGRGELATSTQQLSPFATRVRAFYDIHMYVDMVVSRPSPETHNKVLIC